MQIIDGKITEYAPNGDMTIQAKFENIERYIKCSYATARIMLVDSRVITAEQRKKIYALLGEIAEFVGDTVEVIKREMKLDFRLRNFERMVGEFSLGDCPVELASGFIDHLVAFVIEWGVPCKRPLYELCDDIKKYVYTCLKYKKCAVCGQKADLHHVDQVGMGYDRKEIVHEGMLALPLCRKHHTETHTIGKLAFEEKYHLEPIALNKELCGVYKLKTKKKGNKA